MKTTRHRVLALVAFAIGSVCGAALLPGVLSAGELVRLAGATCSTDNFQTWFPEELVLSGGAYYNTADDDHGVLRCNIGTGSGYQIPSTRDIDNVAIYVRDGDGGTNGMDEVIAAVGTTSTTGGFHSCGDLLTGIDSDDWGDYLLGGAAYIDDKSCIDYSNRTLSIEVILPDETVAHGTSALYGIEIYDYNPESP